MKPLGKLLPFALVLAFFLAELALACRSLSNGPIKMRALYDEITVIAVARVLWFLARVLACHLLAGAALFGLESLFRVRRRAALYLALAAYVLCFNVIRNPQIFDDFRRGDALFFFLTGALGPSALFTPALLFLALLWRERGPAAPGRLAPVASLGLLLLVAWQVRAIGAPRFSSPSAAAPGPAPRGAVILSVDSLRADAALGAAPGTALGRLLADAAVSRGLVAPIAQTHGSLASLLTGLLPTRHGVRHPLAADALDTDRLLAGSAADALRRAGVEIHLLRDGNDNDNFAAGSVIASATEPGDGFSSLVMPFFLRNRFWSAFFNNDLGYLFLPEVRANAAYSYFYRVEYFTDRVARKLAELRAGGRPFVLIVHTCALHWPGAFPFPYYPESRPEGANWSRYAYSSRFLRGSDFGGPLYDLTPRAAWLKRLYASGVRYVTDRFLAPLAAELERQGLRDGTVVVLASDHGDAFPGENRDQPRFYFPQHGSSLLAGADSERAFLRVAAPGRRGGEIPGFVSTTDLLPTIGELLGVPMPAGLDGASFAGALFGKGSYPRRGAYSETGLWPLRGFKGQAFLDTGAFSYLYHLTDDARHVYIGAENEPAIAVVKQRAYLWDRFQLTVFPSSYGEQYFLCDLVADPGCRRDVSAAEPRALAEGLSRLREIVAPDEARGYFPPLAWAPARGEGPRHLPMREAPKAAAPLYLSGLEKIFRERDYAGGARALDSLLGRPDAPAYLQGMATRLLFELCQFSALPSGGRGLHFLTLSDTELAAYGVPTSWITDCPGAYGAAAAAARWSPLELPREQSWWSQVARYFRGNPRADFGPGGEDQFSPGARDLLQRRYERGDADDDPRFRLLWDGLIARKLQPAQLDASLLALMPDARAYELVEELLVRFVARYASAARESDAALAGVVACDVGQRPLPIRYRFLLDHWVDRHSPLGRELGYTVADARRAVGDEARLDRYRATVAAAELGRLGVKAPACARPEDPWWKRALASPESRHALVSALEKKKR